MLEHGRAAEAPGHSQGQSGGLLKLDLLTRGRHSSG